MRQITRFAAALAIVAIAALVLVGGEALLRQSVPRPVLTQAAGIVPTPTVLPEGEDADDHAPADVDDVVITFAAGAAERSRYEVWMAEFHRQYPNITVQFVDAPATGDGGGVGGWLKALAGAADTTVFYGAERRYAMLYFKDLQPLMDADFTFAPDDFWPGSLAACQDRYGHILGIPLTLGLHGVYYDEAAFRAAGLPLPAPGWTWDDFRKAVTALGTPERPAFVDDGSFAYSNLLASLLDSALVANNGERDLEALQSSFQWYLDLAERGLLVGLPEDRSSFFAAGAVPTMWTGYLAAPASGAMGGSGWEAMAVQDYGFAPFPVDAANDHTSPAWATCAGISAGTRHPQEAWAWINFISHQWTAHTDTGAYGDAEAPARQSVAGAAGYWERLPDKIIPAVQYGLAHAWYGPLYPWEFGIVQKALAQTMNEKVEFATALHNAEVEALANVEIAPSGGQVVVAQPDESAPADAVATFTTDNAYNEQENNAFKRLVVAYNQAHPDEKIAFVAPDASLDGTGNDLPDLAGRADCFKFTGFYFGVDSPDLLDLDAFVAAEGAAFIQDYPEAVMADYRQNGTLYSLPAAIYPEYMLYDKALFAKRGLQAPTNDWTFDDFVALATAASSSDPNDISYGYFWLPSNLELLTVRMGEWADWESAPPVMHINTPEMLSAVAWLKQQVRSGVVLSSPTDDLDKFSALQMTLPNDPPLAMWDSNLMIFGREDGGWRDLDVGIISMPFASRGYWSVGYQISKNASNPQACWNWLKFLSEQPNIYLRSLPARMSAAASPEWEQWIGPERAAAYRLAVSKDGLRPRYGGELWPSWPVEEMLADAVSAVVFEDADPQQALAAAQQKADALIACLPNNIADLTKSEIFQEIDRCLAVMP